MAKGCQRKENNSSGSIFSIVISNGKPSCGFCALATSALTFVVTITPRIAAPGLNGPSNFTPNQVPNSVESDSARQTRLSGACRRIFFSMRSVFISNLLVAYYQIPRQHATIGLRENWPRTACIVSHRLKTLLKNQVTVTVVHAPYNFR